MSKTARKTLAQSYGWAIAALGLVAAVAYSTWPLGYYLNPKVGATGYASELAVFGQPYNWVFIIGDVIAGILIFVVVLLLWHWLGKQLSTWHKWLLGLFALFGLLTILGAILPMSCTPSISICRAELDDWQMILHNTVSIAAGLAIYITAFMVWKRYDRDERMLFMHVVMAALTTFGILSFFYAIIPGPAYLAQRYFLIATCTWIFVLPLSFVRDKVLFE
jgi:hypothetical protein